MLSRLVHARTTDPRIGEWLEDLEGGDLTEVQAASVRVVRRGYDRIVKVPESLVVEISKASSRGFGAWVEAKKTNDFASFAPHLEGLVALKRQKAHAIDADAHPYDVMLETYDPGTTISDLRSMFARLRQGLVGLLDALRGAPVMPKLDQAFDVRTQMALQRDVAEALGYDLARGRIDQAEHPFTIGLNPSDVRITTHLYERDLLGGLGGTVHECGHAMYEQGLPAHLAGTGLDSAASLGLHESQSRFWENFIGRSQPFFRWFHGQLKHHYPETTVTPEDLFRGANRVVPGAIRVTADEVTYNLHIIVRFELEVALLEGDLQVADLADAWNEKYRQTLGVTPPDDARGVLQDVHWSGGSFGYFPSYTLGNLYSASLGATLSRELSGLWETVEAGDFTPILSWLRASVHRHGHMTEAPDRIRAVVGERDSVEDLLSYLWSRHGQLHGVTRPQP